MWEGLDHHQARDLKGLPDCRTLLGRPGTACWSSGLLRRPWSLFLLSPRGIWTEDDTRSKNRPEVSSEASPEVKLWLGRKKEHGQLAEAGMSKHSTSPWDWNLEYSTLQGQRDFYNFILGWL